jgi:DNA-binding SARP family transcriptional activator
MMALRIYLTGRMSIESGGKLMDQKAFPGMQGLVAFARLVIDRHHAVSRDELAALLWPRKLPRAWDAALTSIVSKLRVLLAKAGMKKSEVLSSALGCYQLHLPADAWVDTEAASAGLHDAELLIRAGKRREAYGPAQVAYHISRRPFLASENADWVEQHREKLRTVHLRSCECLAEVYLGNSEPALAAEAAKEVIAVQPYRETAYRYLMQAHLATGNRAEALWVYERCRKLIVDELGVAPSPETHAVYLKALKSR